MNENQKKLKKLSKNKKSTWTKDAEFRIRNRKWLLYSNNIARRILAVLEERKEINQKKLATTIKVSPQYISKVVKGKENLSLETIAKLSDALKIELITFPPYKYSPTIQSQYRTFFVGVQAIAFSMNPDDIDYTKLHNILSIDSNTVLLPQKENSFLPLINANIEGKIMDSENFSLIKQLPNVQA